MSDSFIRWFEDITLRDVPLVGGKNASLGELYRELRSAGRPRAERIRHHRRRLPALHAASGLEPRLPIASAGCRRADLADLAARGLAIRQQIIGAEMPADLQDAIVAAYEQLGDGTADRRRRPQQRDRRRPAGRELRRTAGNLPERARPGGACSTPAGDRSRRCSPTGRSPTARTRDSTSCRSRCRSACSGWCAPIWRRPV